AGNNGWKEATADAPLPLAFAFEVDDTAYDLPPERRRPRSFVHAYTFREREAFYWDPDLWLADWVKRQKAPAEEEPARKRGTATAEVPRPDHFPHRIWAACDCEVQTPDYAWFGPAETRNVPTYPGNATALGVREKPYKNFSALMTGINPVPGPMMGK